jgi:hypothetical protein
VEAYAFGQFGQGELEHRGGVIEGEAEVAEDFHNDGPYSFNWWAPGPLRRPYARYGIRDTDEPAPVPAPAQVSGQPAVPVTMQ